MSPTDLLESAITMNKVAEAAVEEIKNLQREIGVLKNTLILKEKEINNLESRLSTTEALREKAERIGDHFLEQRDDQIRRNERLRAGFTATIQDAKTIIQHCEERLLEQTHGQNGGSVVKEPPSDQINPASNPVLQDMVERLETVLIDGPTKPETARPFRQLFDTPEPETPIIVLPNGIRVGEQYIWPPQVGKTPNWTGHDYRNFYKEVFHGKLPDNWKEHPRIPRETFGYKTRERLGIPPIPKEKE